MKQLGAILLVAGAFIAGGTATAGPEKKCTICHFPSHDAENTGDVIIVGESAWKSSHWPHGDCMIGYATENPDGITVKGHSFDDGTCACEPVQTDPRPQVQGDSQPQAH